MYKKWLVSLSLSLSIFATFLIAACSLAQEGPPGAWVPGPYIDMPYYWSGTNCRAMGEVNIYPGSVPGYPGAPQFDDVYLYVGGELVREWHRGGAGGDIPIQTKTLAVMFDSTHFAANSNVEIEIEALDSHDRYYYDSGTSVVKNWSLLYGRYDLEIFPLFKNNDGSWYIPPTGTEDRYRALPHSRLHLMAMGYQSRADVTLLGWTALEFGEDFYECNVFHVNSHGTDGSAWSDTNDYWFEYNGNPGPLRRMIADDDSPPPGSISLKHYRETINGIGLPPYNSTALPPINFGFFDSCKSAITNLFGIGVLYPYANWYTGYLEFPENQSVMGGAQNLTGSEASNYNSALWSALGDTKTVVESRQIAYDNYQGKNKPALATDLFHIWGDFYTRLKGVYTGSVNDDDDSLVGWYRWL